MQIKNRISAFQEEMTSWRHHFHEHPELAYKEINTSKKVIELLKKNYDYLCFLDDKKIIKDNIKNFEKLFYSKKKNHHFNCLIF